jgi:hypothetical protein
MQTYLTQDKTQSPKVQANKVATIYVYLKNIRDNVKKILGPILEGLAHLDINVVFSEEIPLEKALSQCDMMLVLNEEEELLKKAWSQGVVTITNSFNKNIVNYNPNTEKGNSFTFENCNQWEVFAAIVRALETYKFPYDWKFISRTCRRSV